MRMENNRFVPVGRVSDPARLQCPRATSKIDPSVQANGESIAASLIRPTISFHCGFRIGDCGIGLSPLGEACRVGPGPPIPGRALVRVADDAANC
jgi:hypothetical protein